MRPTRNAVPRSRRAALYAGLLLAVGCAAPDDAPAPTTARSAAVFGKEGPRTIAANTVVNQYAVLAADAFAGSNAIMLTALADLRDGSRDIEPGDLVLLIQLQGAVVNGVPT